MPAEDDIAGLGLEEDAGGLSRTAEAVVVLLPFGGRLLPIEFVAVRVFSPLGLRRPLHAIVGGVRVEEPLPALGCLRAEHVVHELEDAVRRAVRREEEGRAPGDRHRCAQHESMRALCLVDR